MLTELTSVPAEAWPVAALAEHLRLSSGFADDGALDARLLECLRAAAAAVEARTGKALLQRRFAVTVAEWSGSGRHVLPLAPVVAVERLVLSSRAGVETLVDEGAYALVADGHRPVLEAVWGSLPVLAPGSHAVIEVVAGYAGDWAGLPPDLAQAVILLAAEFFAQDVAADAGFPASVAALIAPYRTLRLRGGGA